MSMDRTISTVSLSNLVLRLDHACVRQHVVPFAGARGRRQDQGVVRLLAVASVEVFASLATTCCWRC